MPSRVGKTKKDIQASPDPAAKTGSIGDLVLARIATEGGATRNMVTRDLAVYVANKLSPAEWRQTAVQALDHIVRHGLATEKRGRLTVTGQGLTHVHNFLALSKDDAPSWQVRRDVDLIAKAIGLKSLSAQKRKLIATPDGLRVLIVQHAFGISGRKGQTPAKLRAALAVVALERAFGKKIKAGLGEKTNLPAKASRLLAGQLLDQAREFSTDAQLIAHIAADQVGARQTSLDELRQALLCRLSNALLDDKADKPKPEKIATPSVPAPNTRRDEAKLTLQAANDTTPLAPAETSTALPSAAQFVRVVHAAASSCAEGWPGNKKAFISRVWQSIRDGQSAWKLTEDDFKLRLVEAHRAGEIILAGADLKNKTDLNDFEQSATRYKNTVWHFIRVEA